ncbi:MAG: GLUG motif-containing protein [Planctomycetota bacterium]|jgi:hypothetical protein
MSGTRKSNLLVKITIVLIVGGSLSAQAKYGGGTGEPNDPYLIYTAEQMNEIGLSANSDDWDKHFKLMTDIDLSAYTYTTALIAPDTSSSRRFQGTPFTGVFDGSGYKILNLTINSLGVDSDYLSLFGSIGGQVRNLGIEGATITGGDDSGAIGSLCGENTGTITNCYAIGLISGGYDSHWLGGLCGWNDGTIINCYATYMVTGGNDSGYLGGLVGHNDYGTITNCYATGSVSGGYSTYGLGGLCGNNSPDGTISNCCATGSVSGEDDSGALGGLVGNNKGSILNCYAAGSVTGGDGSDYLGGFCGLNREGTITNCYATGPVIGGDNSSFLGGLCGDNRTYYGTSPNCYFYLFSGPDNKAGTMLDDLQMQDAGSFIGFDFAGNANDGEDDYWTIVNGHCPKLTWQTDDGPLIPDPPVTTLVGSGFSHDPFQINNFTDFTEFRFNNGLRCGYYILTTDIDLSGNTYTTAIIDDDFGGHFDGNGHAISNITIDTAGADTDYLGFFSRITASVSDLGIENINITGGDDSDYVGGLCGINSRCTITNCYSTGSVSGGVDSDYLGGLCGSTWHGPYFSRGATITNCYATGSITGGAGSDNLGGLCGDNFKGRISNCHTIVSVTGGGESESLGGLVGYNYYRGTITNCYSAGSVTGGADSDSLGGLCGYNYNGTITNSYATSSVTGGNGSSHLGGLCGTNHRLLYPWVSCGTITNCYATGLVTGEGGYHLIGGLCGYNYYGTISHCYATGSVTGDDSTGYLGGLCGRQYGDYAEMINCFWDTETSGVSIGYNLAPGEPGIITNVLGLPTSQLHQQSTFTGWDFVGETFNGIKDIWFIPRQDYPHLCWEGMQVSMKLTPRTLNCRSKGNWVKAHLTLPQRFTVADVDSNRPAVLHSFGFQSLPLYVSVNENERVQIEAAFERQAVCSLTGNWPQVLTVAGFLTDGNIFLGTSTVRMITPGANDIEELALYWLNADCVYPDFCDQIDLNRDSVVNLLDYALLLNSQVEFVSE